jgi:hypothetical protein
VASFENDWFGVTGSRPVICIAEAILLLLLPLLTAGCLDPCSNCVTSSSSGPGTFSLTGPLNEERAFASASILPDQMSVLVAGGGRLPGYLTRAQLFDPASPGNPPMFASDAELKNARANHTSTLLHDGHVLVCGGDNGLEALNSCELYLPSSGAIGSFEDAASMFATRTHHTATLLKDGRVFMAGGSPAVTTATGENAMGNAITDVVPNGALNTAEFFESTTGNFVGVFDAMTTARTEHTATLLDDGTVLLVGGADQNGAALASAEIFDPRAQTFTPTIGALEVARFDHTATLMHCGKTCSYDGDVLIAGGFNSASQSINFAEFYDPSRKSFYPVPSFMNAPRALHTSSEIDNVGVLIAGGVDNTPHSGFTNLNSGEIFDLNMSSATFGQFVQTGNMADERSGAAAAQVTINGTAEILITFGGGADFNGAFFSSLASSAQYNPDSSAMTFATGPVSPPNPACTNLTINPSGCAVTRTAHTATVLSDGRLLIVGGYEATAVRLPTAEIYSLKNKSFAELSQTMSEPRVFQTSSVIATGAPHAGDIVIAGGDPPCDGSAERYETNSGDFLPIGPMTSPNRCSFFTATPLSDGRILYTGGLDINTNVLNTAELYNPATDSFTAAGNLNTPRWGHAAIQLNDNTGDVLIIGGNSASGNCFLDSSCASGFLNTAELFIPTPTGGSFMPIAAPMNDDRFFASANNLPANALNVLANGVLIAGGSGDNEAEAYNPATQTFPFTTTMNFIRFFQTATTLSLSNMQELVLEAGGSGRNAFDDLIPISAAEIFDPSIGVFCGTGDMTTARAFQTATLLNTGTDNAQVLVAGGFGENSSLGTAELYTPNSNGCSGSSKAPSAKSLTGLSEQVSARLIENLHYMSRVESVGESLHRGQ